MFYWICYIIAWLPLNILFPTRLIQKKSLPKKKPILIACNHLCNVDPVIIQHKCGRKVYFLAKKELFKNKFASFCLKQFGAIPLDRQNVGLGPIKAVLRLLKKNKTICIFPQGTRDHDPHVSAENVKDGVAMFSMKTNTPIVPLAIYKVSKPFRRNAMKFGDIIFPNANDKMNKETLYNYSVRIASAINSLLPN